MTGLTARKAENRRLSDLIVRVARQAGVSPFRQFADILALQWGRNGLRPQEYFDFQVYAPGLSKRQKREFVGEKGSFRLNQRLAPPHVTHMRGFLSDKVAMAALLSQLGLPVAHLQAVFTRHRNLGSIATLRDEAGLLRFLTSEAVFPVFGKPVRGFQGIGSVWIEAVDEAGGVARLRNGEEVALADLVAGIVAEHGEGFMFQSVVEQHPDLSAVIGRAVGTVRVVTVMEQDTPRVLYAVWKLPSAFANCDNVWQKGSMAAAVDVDSGELCGCRLGVGPDTSWIDVHPDSGALLRGFRMPEWESVVRLAIAAHAVFPTCGVLGWDIAIGSEGALVIECNENTAHTLYQLATGRGVLSPDFSPVFDRVAAHSDALLAERLSKERLYFKAR